MPIHNREIARIFNHIADLLEIRGSNPFRVRAYRNAARTIEDQPQSLASMLEEKADLTEIAGIGDDLAGKIAEIVETGSLTLLRKLEAEVPGKLSELLHVAQLGPKRIAALHRELGIDDLDDLAAAARAHKIRDLEGFGEKLEATILEDLERRAGREERIKLAAAEEVAEALRAFLAGVEGVEKVAVAGSFRRRRETVGDLDILVTCTAKSPVMEAFTGYEDVVEVLAQGSDQILGAAARRAAGRLAGGGERELRRGALLFHRLQGAQHRDPSDRRETGA